MGEYHYLHSPGASIIVPVDRTGDLILVRQFRYVSQKESVEFPAGGVKNGDYLETAKDELSEEAHLSAGSWSEVGEFNPYNGVADEICKVYLATVLIPAVGRKDASEEFEILRMSVPQFDSLVDSGEIWDGMTLSSWMLARRHVVDYLGKIE